MHIIGAGGHAKVIIDIVVLGQGVSGVWDENPDVKMVLGHLVRGNLSDFKNERREPAVVAVGSNVIRKKIAESLQTIFGKVIHPKSVVAASVEIGQGTVIMANATINTGAIIGQHVIINTNASIDHECMIADFTHISPQVGLAGNVQVGEGAHIGIGASVIQGIKIGKWAIIGAGTVVIRDVPDYAVVVGNPGRTIKYNSI